MLAEDAAQQLLRFWTELQDPLPTRVAELEVAVVKACAGLPLALEVAGGLLVRQTDPGRWQVSWPLEVQPISDPSRHLAASTLGCSHDKRTDADVVLADVRKLKSAPDLLVACRRC